MKKFDMTRFGRVLKLDFAEGVKPMMWGALAMLLLYLFFFWFAHNIAYHGSWYQNHPENMVWNICDSVGQFGCVAMMFFFLITASILYRAEQKKQQRIAWLMLPATNPEKFVSRWIYMLVFSLVGGILSFVVADGIHIAWLMVNGMPVMDATSYFFNGLPHTSEYVSLLEITSIYGMMIVIHSFFLLGGVLFRKYHFIVTSALMVLMLAVLFSLYNALGLYQQSTVSSDVTAFYTTMIVLETGVIALFTWLAYRLFCRWQVITRKFVNL